LPFLPQLAEAEDCEYVLGFKAIYDLIPDTVGDCIDNVAYNNANGDALQNSKNGLLVWRKADNFTAFTDGYRTWVNGPFGLQQRLNSDRFDWENDGSVATGPVGSPPPTSNASETMPVPSTSSTCALPADIVKFDKFVPDYGGAALGQGTVSNPCDEAINLAIDVFAHASPNGPVVMDGPTIWISNLAPRASRNVSVRVPGSASVTSFSWRFVRVSSSQWCLENSTTSCAWVDPELSSAYLVLADTEEGKTLVSAAAKNSVRIQRGLTPNGVLGYYSPTQKLLVIDRQLDGYSSWVRAAVLGHELQHAADFPVRAVPSKGADCYGAEDRAFKKEAEIWNRLWQGQLPRDIDTLHTELNDIVRAQNKDPEAFRIALAVQYTRQCGE
jgi:hypothetical protein